MFLVDFGGEGGGRVGGVGGGFGLELLSIVAFSTFLFLFLHLSSTADIPCIF